MLFITTRGREVSYITRSGHILTRLYYYCLLILNTIMYSYFPEQSLAFIDRQ